MPWLNALRPHLARSISLTALHKARTQLIVDSLALAGAAAAVIDASGRLRAANSFFISKMAGQMIDWPVGVRFSNPFLQQQFARALLRHRTANRAVQSVGIRDALGGVPFVVHLLPIVGAARELCDGDGVLLLIADPDNACVPHATVDTHWHVQPPEHMV